MSNSGNIFNSIGKDIVEKIVTRSDYSENMNGILNDGWLLQ